MTKDKNKKKNTRRPIEDQSTAAWADTERLQPDSKVPIPGLRQVEDAKDWVDRNKK